MGMLEGKTALVTGGRQGIGRGIADRFAEEGATVTLTGRGARPGDLPAHFGWSGTDVSDAVAVEALAAGFDGLDILVNNVGQSERMSPANVDSDVWKAQIDLNLNSAMMTSRAAIPHMVEQGGGVILNVSSIAASRYLGKPQIAYSAAKAALQQYTKTSAIILARQQIRMNCIQAGLMHTAMVQRMADKYADGDYEGFVKKRHEQVPMGRMGTAQDVAHAALFLVSDEASYITGTELVVDGGVTASIPS